MRNLNINSIMIHGEFGDTIFILIMWLENLQIIEIMI